MNNILRIIIVVLLVAAIVFVVVYRSSLKLEPPVKTEKIEDEINAEPAKPLPKLIDLGGSSCTPCLMMIDVLKELKTEYKGQFIVEAINIYKKGEYWQRYNIVTIPTQVFEDQYGVELFRHEGFMSKADILGKWQELGYIFEKVIELPIEESTPSLMSRIFTNFEHWLKGSVAVACIAAFAWGILSVILSPCHLSSIPLIVAFIDQQGRSSIRRTFAVSVLFSVGILITIGIIGAITACLAKLRGDIGPVGKYIVSAVFFVVGLYLLDVFPFQFSAAQVGMKRKGLLASFLLGLIYGIALGPCTFAYMAPVLGVVFSVSGTAIVFGILILFLYALGHCSVIAFAGTSTGIVQKYLDWNERSKGAIIVKRICGALILFSGLYLIYTT